MRTLRWALVSVIAVLVSCGGGGPNSSTNSEVQTTPTDAAKVMDLVDAKTIWQQTNGSLGGSVLNGGVGVSGGVIFGVLANSANGRLSIWSWNSQQFATDSELVIEDMWNDLFGIDKVQIADLNSDGNDDIFVEYHLNDFAGKAFGQVSGSWRPFTFNGHESLDGPRLSGTTITAIERTCLPSCAKGQEITLNYVWNGTEFAGSADDDFGNTFTMTIGPTCPVFTQNDYEPYKFCDKSNGILNLQKVLYDLSLLRTSSNNPVDGYFGPETEYSVKAYQFANDLPVTGTVEGQWYHDLIENYNLSLLPMPQSPSKPQQQSKVVLNQTCESKATAMSSNWNGTYYSYWIYNNWSDGTRSIATGGSGYSNQLPSIC